DIDARRGTMQEETALAADDDAGIVFGLEPALAKVHALLLKAAEPPVNYTLSLHDALPILRSIGGPASTCCTRLTPSATPESSPRSEEHTSELQSRGHLVCRLLLEKKNRSLR